jgi:hypothetical protein
MKAVLFMVVTAVVLGGLFFFLKPAQVAIEPRAAAPALAQQPKASPVASAKAQMLPVEVPAAERAEPDEYDLVVKAGKLVSGTGDVKARQGDEITLRITSDVADDVHVHGYDRHAHLKPGETTTIRIKATRTGRFPFELHKSRLELGSLEIYPR